MRRQRCQHAVDIEQLVVSTANDQVRLEALHRLCTRDCKQRDQIRIDWNCSNCVGHYEQLGEFRAQLRCVNMERASRRR
jgi:hypothetical protein